MHKNKELIKTIKKILQVFPEGIIIQSFDQESQNLIMQFVNDAAVKNISSSKDLSKKT